MYRKVLVPLDGSELSEVVFPYARELVGRLGLDVVLLHVQEPKDSEAAWHRSYIEQKVEIIKSQSAAAREKAAALDREGIRVEGEVIGGYPPEEILRYTVEHDVDLILLATHGRSGIRSWLMGSVAEKVLQASPVPVLLVRANVPEGIVYDKWPRRTILVPLDGSELAETVLPHVEALARRYRPEETEVVLLRVADSAAFSYYPPSARFETYDGAVHLMPEDLARQQAQLQKTIAQRYLAEVKAKISATGLSVTTEVRYGNAADEIIDYTRNNPFNLIIMATHARSGLSRWAYGSVAHRVLQGVASPVLMIRTHQP